MNKLLDLRFVIGLFFLITGALLLGYSFLSSSGTGKSVTINRWCGIIFILFGLFMNIIRSQANKKALPQEAL